MYRLVIAEKPSVAKLIANVLAAKKREDGYIEGNGYLVSWCFGHLAEFASPDAYDTRYEKWSIRDLPILPENWQYVISRDKGKQFNLLKKLMNRADVSEVINACDAGREGELIFRTVYNLAGCNKPMKRLWISSMEDDAIQEGFDNLQDGIDYDSLYLSALCRSKADWLVGINATRLYSVRYHRTLNVGRVVSPTLAMLVDREAEIDSFKLQAFYVVHAVFKDFDAVTERYWDKSEAEQVQRDCAGKAMIVKSVIRREKTEKAPALYDLTTLQRDANRQLGFTAQQTLDYTQSLYEKKLVTYPRTDSRYLTDDMEDSVRAIAFCSSGICGIEVPDLILAPQVCDSKKVSDHHAIIPTILAGSAKLETLLPGERAILQLIAKQALLAIGEPYRYEETTVTLEGSGAVFTAKGRRVLNYGWKALAGQEKEDDDLPFLKEWDMIIPDSLNVKEGKTTPPKHFTEDTLLSAMENAGVQDMPDDAERKGLGTPATRAGILEKLIETGFVERQKNKKAVNLIPTQVGRSLITVLPEQLRSPRMTAEWENQLKMIEHGKADADTFLRDIAELVEQIVQDQEIAKGSEILFPSGREIVGRCPRCGGSVTDSKQGYFCEKADCRFGLWRDSKYLTVKKIDLTGKMVSELLTEGKTYVSGIYSEKTNRNYNAFLSLEDDGVRSTYKLIFEKESK